MLSSDQLPTASGLEKTAASCSTPIPAELCSNTRLAKPNLHGSSDGGLSTADDAGIGIAVSLVVVGGVLFALWHIGGRSEEELGDYIELVPRDSSHTEDESYASATA